MANPIPLLKLTFLLVFMNVPGIIPLFAQVRASGFEDLWVCPVFEVGLYGVSNPSFGGGLAVGYGDRMAFGIKAVYWSDMGEVRELELNVLVRHYFFSTMDHPGLFIEFSGGPVLIINPTKAATISAGLSVGWRFHLGDRLGGYFFIEPFIRGGHPYFVTAGLSAGVRF
jgi:hypothetical protein